jgi:hypothetical protein
VRNEDGWMDGVDGWIRKIGQEYGWTIGRSENSGKKKLNFEGAD